MTAWKELCRLLSRNMLFNLPKRKPVNQDRYLALMLRLLSIIGVRPNFHTALRMASDNLSLSKLYC